MFGPSACAAAVAGSASASLVHSVIPPTIGELVVGSAGDVVVGAALVVVGVVVGVVAVVAVGETVELAAAVVLVGSADFSASPEQPTAVAATTTVPRVATAMRFMVREPTHAGGTAVSRRRIAPG